WRAILFIKGQIVYRHEVIDTRNAHRSTEYRHQLHGHKVNKQLIGLKRWTIFGHKGLARYPVHQRSNRLSS
ncbi:hypothetical protein QWT36_23635, partial [Salmonella enterica subsp. enterica serovar Typhi]|nr:hypothetical protein [Salmonella enterica subsp. enterica serovar Typhi]